MIKALGTRNLSQRQKDTDKLPLKYDGYVQTYADNVNKFNI